MARGIIISVLLLIILACFLSTSTNRTSLSVYLGGAGAEARARIVEFARTHDWEAELAHAGLSLPPALARKVIAPLRGEAVGDDPSFVRWEVHVVHRGIPDSVVGPDRMERACRLIQSRLSTESAIIRGELVAERLVRKALFWEVYASGFDRRARDFFAARSAAEPDPELRALCDEFLRRLR